MKLKKTITRILSTAMIISLLLCMTGCGNKKKDVLDDETISAYQQMSSLLTQYKELLEGDSEVSDEKYDEMIEWFSTTEQTLKDAKAEIEAAVSSVTE